MARHYIATSGSFGCLPDNCQSYPTVAAAIEALNSTFTLTPTALGTLTRQRYADLPQSSGADYLEVVACNCTTPDIHNDN